MTCALSPVLCDVGLLTRIQLRDADVWVAVIASHVYWGVWGLLQVMLAAALALMPISFRCFRYRPRYAGMMMKCRWTSSCIPTNTPQYFFLTLLCVDRYSNVRFSEAERLLSEGLHAFQQPA
jgi:hypothetical protein